MTPLKIFGRTVPLAPDCLVFDGQLNGQVITFNIYRADATHIVADAPDFDMNANTPEELETKLARFQVGPATFAGYDNMD